jgi:O-antigen/teichoic acid export membrane protein
MKKWLEKRGYLEVINSLKKRKFIGYTGLAIKNSIYQFLTSLVGKVGGLIFTIILARILMPELFGLYSLALSTIFIFISLTDLGISSAIVVFVSKYISQNKDQKAKAYLTYLFKLRILLLGILIIFLALSSKFLAQNYYQKPIFLALLAGTLYLIFFSLITFIQSILHSLNKFKEIFYKEIFSQIIRFVLAPLFILFILKKSLSQEINLFWIVAIIALTYFFALIFLWILTKNKIKFLKTKNQLISKKEKIKLILFILPLSATIFTEAFFGNIDIIMLGRFISAELIGYYKASFILIFSIAPLLSFSTVLFPIFSRLKGKRLEKGFKKTINIILPLSVMLSFLIFIFTPLIVKIIFGKEYLGMIPFLRLFSILLFSLPLTQVYISYLISLGKSKEIMRLLICSTLMNILLNLGSISLLKIYGEIAITLGVALSTILSRYFFLLGAIYYKRK